MQIRQRYSVLTTVLLVGAIHVSVVFAQHAIRGRQVKEGFWRNHQVEYVDGQILLKPKIGVTKEDVLSILPQLQVDSVKGIAFHWYLINFPDSTDIISILNAIQGNSLVEAVEPNAVGHGLSIPNDPLFGNQWYLRNTGQSGGTAGADIHITQAWDISMGDTNVTVGILDSGIPLLNDTLCHPDLKDHTRFILGPDYIDDDGNVQDWYGHGTMVAGVVGATANNGIGIAGIANHSKVMVIKALGDDNNFEATAIDSGVNYAINHGVKVINCSLGKQGPSAYLEEAVDSANAHGVTLICAAGNDSTVKPVLYPAAYAASYSNVICVAATDPSDHPSSFSSRGSEVTLSAPGGLGWYYTYNEDGFKITHANLPCNDFTAAPNYDYGMEFFTDYSTEYTYAPGTSAASPVVAGVAALMLSVNQTLTPSQIRNILKTTVDVPSGWDSTQFGSGRVNAYKALKAALAAIPAPIPSSPTNGATVSISPKLVWYRSPSAKVLSYELQVATDTNFTHKAIDTSGITDSSCQVTCLSFSTRYYWRVGALLVDTSINWSAFSSFYTPVPQLVSPGSCATVSNPPTLVWNACAVASSYRLQVSRNSNFCNLAKDTTGITDTSHVTSGLSNDTTYYWRVCPLSSCDSSHWSTSGYFHTSPPQAAQLTGGYTKWTDPYFGLVASPYLHWTVTGWCNITYALYGYTCSAHHGCTDTIGTSIYSGTDTSYTDSSWLAGGDTTYVRHYYVKATSTQTGQSSNSNKVSYDWDNVEEKRGFVYNDTRPALPKVVALEGNYPEPFNPTTTIRYAIPATMDVRLTVYNVLGQNVKNLVDETEGAGYKSVTFDASNLPSGIYFYRLEAVDVNNPSHRFLQARKMLLLK